MTFSAEYRDRAGARNQRDEERFLISDDDDDDDDKEEDMEETLKLLGICVPPRRESATRRDSTQFKRVSRQETAREAIDNRCEEFETTMLDDDNL